MAQLDRNQVVKKNGEWKIEHNGRHAAAFQTQAEAIKEARAKAKQATKRSGETSQVLVQAET